LYQAYRKPAGGAGGPGKDKKVAKFELTEEQKQEIREAFDLFDTDGSGEWIERGRANDGDAKERAGDDSFVGFLQVPSTPRSSRSP
jgi:hypothetical protein